MNWDSHALSLSKEPRMPSQNLLEKFDVVLQNSNGISAYSISMKTKIKTFY